MTKRVHPMAEVKNRVERAITVGTPSYLFTFIRFVRSGRRAVVLRRIPFTLDSEGIYIRRIRFTREDIEKVAILYKKEDTPPVLLIRTRVKVLRFRIKKSSIPVLTGWCNEVGVPLEIADKLTS